MRRRICILLAAVLLLLCLSGISAGADDNIIFFYNEKTKEWVSGSGTNVKDVTVVWTIQNNDILVEAKRQWNPFDLRYDVTEISVTDFCSPQITFTITSNSEKYYFKSSLIVTPEDGFEVSVQTPVYAKRKDVKLISSNKVDTWYDSGINYPVLNNNINENVDVVSVDGISTIGPWYTAPILTYCTEDKNGVTVTEDGYSQLQFALTVSNSDLLCNLRNPENWTDSHYIGGDTVTIANITIVIDMVHKDNMYDWSTEN